MATSTASTSYTVLRIKRKATEAPLSSLVIQDAVEDRIKKRRDISGKARGVFRLAETVPHTWEGRGKEGEVLRTKIADLLSAPPEASTPVTHEEPDPQPKEIITPTSPKATATATQYRVIPPPKKKNPRTSLPPRVIPLAEIASGISPLVFVDARAVSGSSLGGKDAIPSGKLITKSIPPALSSSPQGEEMAAFQSMLQEYLKLDQSGSSTTGKSVSIPPLTAMEVDEYVYDLYYRDVRPEVISGVAAMGLGLGDGVRGVGALLGYEDLSPPSSPSDSEIEDEADEDSNDENYYGNDYPEDEDADEDMAGHIEAGSDGEWSNDGDGSEGEGGGQWDYR